MYVYIESCNLSVYMFVMCKIKGYLFTYLLTYLLSLPKSEASRTGYKIQIMH